MITSAIVFFVLLVMLFINLKIRVKAYINMAKKESYITFSALGGLFNLKYDLKWTKKTQRKRAVKFICIIKGIKYMLNKTTLSNLFFHMKLGLDDAYYTALATGFFISVSNIILSILKQTVKVNNQNINILPCYNVLTFELDFDCIISIKLGHIIIAGFKMVSCR
ncbi:MAG: DUF2953 domain-containing protein [Clostridia bacterium]|nr:DUF2953 domain-containing protein [Clostridia bacterium]